MYRSLHKIHLLVLVLLCLSITAYSSENKPISFQENKGQIHDQYDKQRPDVLFSGSDAALVFHLKRDGISYQLNKVENLEKPNTKARFLKEKKESSVTTKIYRIDVKWLNCNTNAKVTKGIASSDVANFYSDVCPNGVLHVKSYNDITYQQIYAGINLRWYNHNGHLKYEYQVSPGFDFRQIQLQFNGAEKLSVNAKGQLCIQTPFGDLIEEAPVVYQEGKQLVSSWVIDGSRVHYDIQQVDPSKSLLIDPMVRLWATYYGGSGYDWIGTPFTDHLGNVFISGGSTSANLNSIATVGAFQTVFGGGNNFGDAYLVKFNAAGQRQWATYFGSTGDDFSNCTLVDANGDIYISGGTTSTNSAVMTTPGSQQPNYTGGAMNVQDAYLAKFNASGQRLWSTYFGEVGTELTYAIAADFQNDIYIVGMTGSTTNTYVATAGAHQTTNGGGYDAFIAKYNSAGTKLWSSFYGGSGDEYGIGCITDPLGNVYMGGITSSSTAISTNGSHQVSYGGSNAAGLYGNGDAFLVKFNTSGQRQWGTYYGGSGNEYIYYLASDQNANIYFSGNTSTSGGTVIATTNAHQSNFGGGTTDAMFGKFDANGQRIWASYYGGIGDEDFSCCFTNQIAGNLYVSGITSSVGGTVIATPCAYQYTYGGGNKDAYLAKFDYQGKRLWATYYGGTGIEDWTGITCDPLGNVYLTCESTSTNGTVITSTTAHQGTYGGGTYDALMVKFDPCVPIAVSPITTTAACKGDPFILQSNQSCALKWFSDSTLTNILYTGNSFTTNALNHDTVFYFADVSCGLSGTAAAAHVSVTPGPNVSILVSSNAICKGEKVLLTPSGAINYTWTNLPGQYSISVTPSVLTVYTVTGNIYNGGCTGKATVTVTVNDCIGIPEYAYSTFESFSLYPNPSKGSITLSANSKFEIRILDATGRVVFKSKETMNEIHINLTTGFYLVEVRNDHDYITKKIIVNETY